MTVYLTPCILTMKICYILIPSGKFPAYGINIHILDCKGKGTLPSTSSLDQPSSLKRHADNPGPTTSAESCPVKKHAGSPRDIYHIDRSASFSGIVSNNFRTGRGGGKTRGRGGSKTRGRGRGSRGGQNSGGGVGTMADGADKALDVETPAKGKRGRGAKSRGRGRGHAQMGGATGSSPVGEGGRGSGAGRGRGRGRGRGGGKGAPVRPKLPDVLHDYSSDSSDDSNDSQSLLSPNHQGATGSSCVGNGGRGRGVGRGRGRGRGGGNRAPANPELPNFLHDSSSDSSDDSNASQSLLSPNHQGATGISCVGNGGRGRGVGRGRGRGRGGGNRAPANPELPNFLHDSSSDSSDSSDDSNASQSLLSPNHQGATGISCVGNGGRGRGVGRGRGRGRGGCNRAPANPELPEFGQF